MRNRNWGMWRRKLDMEDLFFFSPSFSDVRILADLRCPWAFLTADPSAVNRVMFGWRVSPAAVVGW